MKTMRCLFNSKKLEDGAKKFILLVLPSLRKIKKSGDSRGAGAAEDNRWRVLLESRCRLGEEFRQSVEEIQKKAS